MNLILALLLQSDNQPTKHTPGDESIFSRIMIIVFIVTLAVAATAAIYMVLRGASGANKAHNAKVKNNDKTLRT